MIKAIVDYITTHLMLLLASIIGVLTPIYPLMVSVGFLIVVDFIFAIYKAYKVYGRKGIKSRKMSHSISKILLYNLSLISVFVIQKWALEDALPLAKIAAGLMLLVEFKSLDESFKILFGYSIYDKVKLIISRGTSTTKDIIDEADIYKEVKEFRKNIK